VGRPPVLETAEGM